VLCGKRRRRSFVGNLQRERFVISTVSKVLKSQAKYSSHYYAIMISLFETLIAGIYKLTLHHLVYRELFRLRCHVNILFYRCLCMINGKIILAAHVVTNLTQLLQISGFRASSARHIRHHFFHL